MQHQPWPVRQHGTQAQAALGVPRGRVIAVFKRSFYLQTTSGLACIGPLGLGAGPLNALADLPSGMDWQASGLQLKTPVKRIGNLLDVGSFRFFIGDSLLWRAPSGSVLKPLLLRQGLRVLASTLHQRPTAARGLGCLIAPLIDNNCALTCYCSDDLFMQALPAAISDITNWLVQHEKTDPHGSSVPETLVDLLGMGPGLTPSGDDFIAGILLALRFLGKDRQADRLAVEILAKAKSRTGLISYHHLSAAAQGQASAAIHELLCALGDGRTCLRGELDTITAIGHSSGWDTLAGITAVLAQDNLRPHQPPSKPPANSAA